MTIWYDYTTSLRNQGRSGIAAVEWQLGAAIRQADPSSESVRGFALDERDGLVEIDVERRLRHAVYADVEPVAVLPSGERTGLRIAVRAALATAVGGRDSAGDETLVRLFRRIRAQRARAITAIRLRLPPRRQAVALKDRVQPGDVIVSMGADWSGNLTKQLASLRQTRKCFVVTMVFDLIPLTHTHLAFHADRALFDSYYRGLIETSDLIVCISNRTQQDLIEFAARGALRCPPTTVLRLGDGVAPPATIATASAGFFLAVGTVERRKNLELVYDALRILHDRGEQLPTVVVAGGMGWGVDDWLAEHQLQTTPASRAMVLLGSVDEVQLEHLYTHAEALVFPSQYEGGDSATGSCSAGMSHGRRRQPCRPRGGGDVPGSCVPADRRP